MTSKSSFSYSLQLNHSVDLIIIYKDIIITIIAIPQPVVIIIISKNSTFSTPKVGIKITSNEIKETKLVIIFMIFEDEINGLLYFLYLLNYK